MTTHTARNHPNEPRPVHGPSSIPLMTREVHHQPTTASATSTTTSARWARTAANAGRRPSPADEPTGRAFAIRSGCPRELRRRQPCLGLELDAEGVDARPLR